MKWILASALAAIVVPTFFASARTDDRTTGTSAENSSAVDESNPFGWRIASEQPTFRDLIEAIGGEDDLQITGTDCSGPSYEVRPIPPAVCDQVFAALLAEPCPSMVTNVLVSPCPFQYEFEIRSESDMIHVEIDYYGGLSATVEPDGEI